MHLRWGPRRCSPRLLAQGGGPDLISALPDDLLVLILAGLPCVSAAARTGVLSRRWRSLWPRLRQIVFNDVPFHSLEAVLGRLPRPPPAVSLIEIRFPNEQLPWPIPKEQLVDAASVNSLLCAAAWLDPEEFEFELPTKLFNGPLIVDLPFFHRATSILLDLHPVILRVPPGVEFPALEELHLWGCTVDIDTLLSRSPRLRTLSLSNVYSYKEGGLAVSAAPAVSSASLQELVMHQTNWVNGVNIVAPVLKQLTMSFSTMEKVSISVLAPMAEMVSWRCCYLEVPIVFGVWRLEQVSLQTAKTPGQLPSLQIHASANSISVSEEETFMHEIQKHMFAEFSVLELHLETNGHVFGPLAFHVLGMNRICSAMQKLKVILQRSSVKEGCSPHCPCESTGWRSQTISLTRIEEVEISGCGGDNHEIDFLKLILKCAPMLKKMIVKLSDGASSSDDGCTNIYNIFKDYSSVELHVYLSSGLMLGSQNSPSA